MRASHPFLPLGEGPTAIPTETTSEKGPALATSKERSVTKNMNRWPWKQAAKDGQHTSNPMAMLNLQR